MYFVHDLKQAKMFRVTNVNLCNMNVKRLLSAAWLFVFLTLCATISFAQSRTVTGKITDNKGAGIPGVSIVAKGTTTGTQTDADGNFTISVPQNVNRLVLSAVGYGEQEAAISGNTVNMTLETAASNLNEVVVVGYGTARRKDVTGAVASVRSKDFNKGIITSPDQAIQGKAAGVMVLNNSGQPGGATTIRIRGTSSIRSGNQPLFVVDGVQLPGGDARPGGGGAGIGSTPGANPLNFINPNDIASVEILKDASATAIYGSRGANGVVLITTKRGQSGTPTVEAGASMGFSNIMKRLEVLDAAEYRTALKNYNLTGGDYGGNVDALDAILRTGLTQSYNAAIAGGNENGRYRVSASYLDQQGIVKESGFKKMTAGLTSSYRLLSNKKLGLDFNILTSQTNEQLAPISNDAGFTGSLIGQALQWNPTHPLYQPDGSVWVNNQIGATTVNPLALLGAHHNIARVNTILASVSPSYKFTNNLEYRLLYSMNRSIGYNKAEMKQWINLDGIRDRGVAEQNTRQDVTQQITNTLSYNKQISSDLNLNAVVGHEYISYDNDGYGIFGSGFPAVDIRYYDILQYPPQSQVGVYSFRSPITELQSFLGRAILNYKDRYLVTATFRADGSTKFGENNKYGYFPSVALAWNLTNEDFLKGNSTINNLRLRGSWGRTGNQEFTSGASLRQYTFGRQSVGLARFPNPDLRWEESTTSNIGLDFGFFRDRLFGSIELFDKKTTGVLFENDVAQPGPQGPKYWLNLPGYIKNRGVEISVTGNVIRNKDMNLNLGVNASFLDNIVEGLTGFYETGALHGQGISGARAQRLVNGQPLNVYYLPVFEGIDKTTGQSIYQGGDPASNKFYQGSPNPTTLLGLSAEFQYKKLTATVNMNGTFGHFLYNNTANTALPIGNLGTRNVAKSIINSPVKEDASNPITPSTRYLEKGNYLKMANATLAYNLGAIGKTFRGASISLTGQNLFVLTNFTGFDPEVNTDKQVGGVPSLGIEYTPYPTARNVILGFNFQL